MRRFLNDDGGAAAIEYGIIVGCIAIAIVAGVMLLGDDIQAGWDVASRMLAE